jgi:hypothetical protein
MMINQLKKYLSKRKIVYLILCLFILMLILLFPFDLTLSPERKFKVVDDSGKPIPAANVKQISDQYSLEYSKEERLLTGSNGMAILPRRVVRTRLIDLLTGAVHKIVMYKIHASIGTEDSLYIHAFGYESKWFYNGEGLGETVVLKRQ